MIVYDNRRGEHGVSKLQFMDARGTRLVCLLREGCEFL